MVPAVPVLGSPPRLGIQSPIGFPCPYCQQSFNTKIGLGVHRRRAHAKQHHAELESYVSKKGQWSDEELRLLALNHALLLEAEPGILRRESSFKLAEMHADSYHRSQNQIYQCILKKQEYELVFSQVMEEGSSLTNDPNQVPASSPLPRSREARQNEVHWATALKAGFLTILLASVDFSVLTPGIASEGNQSFINEDFLAWLPVIAPKSFKGFKQGKLPTDKRPRRRAQYRRMQRL